MILFKDLLTNNETELKSFMEWENYDMNDVTIPLVEKLKDHSLMVLSKSYGMFHVEQSILDELCADIFIYFPILMQQLAISRLMDAYGVVPDDINTETLTRTETLASETEQNSELRLGNQSEDSTVLNTQQTTTGTVGVDSTVETNRLSNTSIENTSGIDSTGGRSVSLDHSMPEQAINGGTGNFPIDDQGTPILSTSYVQGASENFNTSNPINTTETSESVTNNSDNTNSESMTTNDVTVANTGTNVRTLTNTGKDESDSLTSTDSVNSIEETRTRSETNKQYAYEIKAFLESTDTLNAFKRWENNFSWVVGII